MDDQQYLFGTKNYFTFYKCSDDYKPCVVICPGGGYDHTSKREAENVALVFNNEGFHACVLNYRETLESYPFPQKQLAYTIDFLRKHKEEYKIKSDKVITMGFSAGGHLVLSNALYYKEYGYNSKPDYMILCYPVISSSIEYGHQGSFNQLLKGIKTDQLLDHLSLEKHISSDLPDTFLWHTFTDNSVNVQNSINLLSELNHSHVNVEAHFFCEGGHGLSLADDTTMLGDIHKKNEYVHRWVEMMFEWLHRKNIQ